jgi:hypothetical protein
VNTTRSHLITLAASAWLATPVLAQEMVTRIVVPFANSVRPSARH